MIRRLGALAGTAALLAVGLPATANAVSASCDTRVNNTVEKLLECVTLDGVREHQAALQAIADANNGTRVSGSPGFDDSADYAESRVPGRRPGGDASRSSSSKPSSSSRPPSWSRWPRRQRVRCATSILSYSGSGDVTAAVTTLPTPPTDNSPGCEAADFAGFPAGSIALISRGTCSFAIKATNAYNAGASAVVIYNNTSGTLNGTLGNGFTLDIPVTSVTQAVGQQLAATPGLVMRVKTDTFRGSGHDEQHPRRDTGRRPGQRRDGRRPPGLGQRRPGDQRQRIRHAPRSSRSLEQMAKVKPVNKVRFALWGAEESGLVGSTYYVNNLSGGGAGTGSPST